ncbi:HD-GYP domain-containing protein [Tepidibacter sp. Z1-5]|uniref:HD-GYP domain-containing protein n=1 Tax=Tepidibacter sp. Z1-5 TaxID=3134138 RepID=UPI0030BE12E1
MEERKIFIDIDELKSGMVLAQHIVNKNGVFLLFEGFEFKEIEKIKEMLLSHNIHNLKVIVKEGMDDTYTKEYFQIYDFRQNMNELINDIKHKFYCIESGEEVNREDFEKTIEIAIRSCNGSVSLFKLMNKIKDMEDYIYMHSMNSSLISYQIGKWLDLKEEELKELTLSAILSDLGKMKVSKEIINKPNILTYEEYLEVKKHSIFGYKLIKGSNCINNKIKRAVLEHHERIDGSGYPRGIKGDEISLYAKIIGIADVYSALTSKRPHRDRNTPFEAIKILEEEFVSKLDTKILYLFLKKVAAEYLGSEIILNDGRTAKIVFIPSQNICKPLIEMEENGEVVDLGSNQNSKLYIKEFIL